jgi:hypothetical protein
VDRLDGRQQGVYLEYRGTRRNHHFQIAGDLSQLQLHLFYRTALLKQLGLFPVHQNEKEHRLEKDFVLFTLRGQWSFVRGPLECTLALRQLLPFELNRPAATSGRADNRPGTNAPLSLGGSSLRLSLLYNLPSVP